LRLFLSFIFALAWAGCPVLAQQKDAEQKDAHQPIVEWKAHEGGWGLRLAISPDGKKIATAGSDRRGVRLWEMQKDPARGFASFGPAYRYWSLAFSPDGERIMAGGGQNFMVWNADGSGVKNLPNYQAGIWGGTFLADGRMVSAGWNRRLQVYDVDGKRTHSHALPKASRCIVAVGKTEVALSQFTRDKEPASIEVRDVTSGKVLDRFEGHEGTITCIDVCPTNSNILVSSSADRSVRVWDRDTGKQRMELAGHGGSFLSWGDGARFSPDGAYIATCADLPANTLMVWHLASGRLHWKSASVRSGLIDVAFFPDKEGYRVAAMGKDNLVRVWQVEPDPERYPIDLTKAREQIGILGNQVLNAEDPEAALELGNIVLTLSKNIAEIYPAEHLDFLIRFAAIQSKAKKYKESAATYEQALAIHDANYKDVPKFRYEGVAELKQKLAILYAMSGEPEKAATLLDP